jgi:transcriptional regulator with XRE-family HTH domain
VYEYAISRLSAPLPYQRRAWARCLGRVIADIRERRGLSAAEAARLAGMETAQWQTIEAGKSTLGTPEQFQAMAEILGIDWGVVRLLVHVLCIPFRMPHHALRAAGTWYS